MVLAGTVIVGVSSDDPSEILSADAKEMVLDVIGVDLETVQYRGKFVFVGQVGSPQKAAAELRERTAPAGLAMDVLITGRSTTYGAL